MADLSPGDESSGPSLEPPSALPVGFVDHPEQPAESVSGALTGAPEAPMSEVCGRLTLSRHTVSWKHSLAGLSRICVRLGSRRPSF